MQLLNYEKKDTNLKLYFGVGFSVLGFFIGYIISGEYSYFASLVTILLVILALYIRSWHINVLSGEAMLLEEIDKCNREITQAEQKRI